jgi:hypothetical protein
MCARGLLASAGEGNGASSICGTLVLGAKAPWPRPGKRLLTSASGASKPGLYCVARAVQWAGTWQCHERAYRFNRHPALKPCPWITCAERVRASPRIHAGVGDLTLTAPTGAATSCVSGPATRSRASARRPTTTCWGSARRAAHSACVMRRPKPRSTRRPAMCAVYAET